MPARSTIRDPARLTFGRRQTTIKRHAAFCDDKWLASDNPFVKGLIYLGALISQYAMSHVNAGILQLLNSSTGVARIWINCSDDDMLNLRAKNRVSARRGTTCSGARLQRYIQCGPRRQPATEVADALDLRVIMPRLPVMSSRDDSIVHDQNRSNSRIWTGSPERFFCFLQRNVHELLVSIQRHLMRTNNCRRFAKQR